MKKKRFVKFAIAAIVAVVACIGFTGCMDDIKDVYKGKTPEEPNTFSFSTKKTVEFALKYDVPTGYRVHFEMYSKSPITLDQYKSYVKDSTLIPFFSGLADENGKITFKGDLPSTVKEIYSYCTGFGMPTLMKASVSDAGVVSNFEVTPVPKAGTTRANELGPSGTDAWATYNVKLTKPILAPVSREILAEDKVLIDKSFKVNQDYDVTKTYVQPYIKLLKDARVKIYSVYNGLNSERTNALAYFTFKDENVSPENANLQLIYPELTKTVPAEGQGYQLLNDGDVNFKAGSSIGFALFPDIKNGNIPTNNAHLFFSYFKDGGTWNSYHYPSSSSAGTGDGLFKANVPHMLLSLLRTTADGHAIIAIGFEDQPWDLNTGTNKGDFRDDVFILEIDPASSLPDLPTPPVEKPEYDGQFTKSGILCFEDSWPKKGDYDLNDVVIAYERTMFVKNGVGPVAMEETYTFLNNGATFENGFGYQILDINKSNIQLCTVTSDYKCAGQGLDPTLDIPVVMLFDNAKSLKSGVNGTTFKVYTSFAGGMYYKADSNPFIVVKNYSSANDYLSKDRVEVHLPSPTSMLKYLPTTKANVSLFHTEDDKSDIAKQLYYVREGNYPFALEINWDSSAYGSPAKFIIPEEKLSIEKTYPKFTNWVDSKGDKDADWYLHPNK